MGNAKKMRGPHIYLLWLDKAAVIAGMRAGWGTSSAQVSSRLRFAEGVKSDLALTRVDDPMPGVALVGSTWIGSNYGISLVS